MQMNHFYFLKKIKKYFILIILLTFALSSLILFINKENVLSKQNNVVSKNIKKDNNYNRNGVSGIRSDVYKSLKDDSAIDFGSDNSKKIIDNSNKNFYNKDVYGVSSSSNLLFQNGAIYSSVEAGININTKKKAYTDNIIGWVQLGYDLGPTLTLKYGFGSYFGDSGMFTGSLSMVFPNKIADPQKTKYGVGWDKYYWYHSDLGLSETQNMTNFVNNCNSSKYGNKTIVYLTKENLGTNGAFVYSINSDIFETLVYDGSNGNFYFYVYATETKYKTPDVFGNMQRSICLYEPFSKGQLTTSAKVFKSITEIASIPSTNIASSKSYRYASLINDIMQHTDNAVDNDIYFPNCYVFFAGATKMLTLQQLDFAVVNNLNIRDNTVFNKSGKRSEWIYSDDKFSAIPVYAYLDHIVGAIGGDASGVTNSNANVLNVKKSSNSSVGKSPPNIPTTTCNSVILFLVMTYGCTLTSNDKLDKTSSCSYFAYPFHNPNKTLPNADGNAYSEASWKVRWNSFKTTAIVICAVIIFIIIFWVFSMAWSYSKERKAAKQYSSTIKTKNIK